MKAKNNNAVFIIEWTAIAVNAGLFLAKFILGTAMRSIALIADAWNGLFDSVTSLVVIIGAKASKKPADREHPFGHGRAELIATLIVGVLIVFMGFTFLSESVQRLFSHEGAEFNGFVIAILYAVSITAKTTIAGFSLWIAKKTNSSALRADGINGAGDVIASVVVLTGALFGRALWWIDGALGILVALFILYSAVEAVKDAISRLIGKAPSKELIEAIKTIVTRYAGENAKPHHFHYHDYAEHAELTFHIHLCGDISLREAHRAATHIESAIRDELNVEATIHIEPRYNGEA